ncbi:MAG: DUF1841 family protein [Pseudomonadota bacterium]
MFSSNRDDIRKAYSEAWSKAQKKQPLTPLEMQIADVIQWHPEYQSMMNESALQKEYLPGFGETNPFLHMGLHMGIREQIATDRPQGIKKLFQKALPHFISSHEAEHFFMEILGEVMWESQKSQQAPSDEAYLKKIKKALKKAGIN